LFISALEFAHTDSFGAEKVIFFAIYLMKIPVNSLFTAFSAYELLKLFKRT
jgi:hypothetical protein